MDQHSEKLNEIAEDVKDVRKGLGAVQLAMSERHGQFMLLKQTVDGFVERMRVHCKTEDDFYEKTNERISELEDDKLIRDNRRDDTDRRNQRQIKILGLLIPIVYALAMKIFAGLYELMKR